VSIPLLIPFDACTLEEKLRLTVLYSLDRLSIDELERRLDEVLGIG
jgi:hypothetical protein